VDDWRRRRRRGSVNSPAVKEPDRAERSNGDQQQGGCDPAAPQLAPPPSPSPTHGLKDGLHRDRSVLRHSLPEALQLRRID
jgi:hypothetical protein